MARQLLDAGDLSGAEGLARKAAAIAGNSREPWLILALIAERRNDLPAAHAHRQKAVEVSLPADMQQLLAAEIDRLLRVATERTSDPVAWFDAGKALHEARDMDRAISCYRRALELEPRYTAAMNNLGLALNDCGETSAAIETLRSAIGLPGGAIVWDNYLYVLHFIDQVSAEAIASEHAAWAHACAPPAEECCSRFANDPAPDRRLRIGYVSPHFHRHPVGRLLLKLFACQDRTQADVFCYSGGVTADAVTANLRAGADHWIDVRGISDAALAGKIRSDRIDVLVDLTMHMAGNRLGVFARRAAPVQISYLAYVSTTGVPAMDYRLTDPRLDPAGRRLYGERNLWLPESYWCYEPASEAPQVNALPAIANNRVTFASLNAFCKVSSRTLHAWIQILQQVPGSELLIHAYPGAHRERVTSLFSAAGIGSGRVRFFDRLSLKDYLRLHHEIDIALDPFAYAGGTTTLDAAFMGVATISLAGETPHTRGGASILHALGLPDLVAHREAEYVDAAVRLAGDLSRLAGLRGSLRQRLLESSLCDGPGFACGVHAAYRDAWRRWCIAG